MDQEGRTGSGSVADKLRKAALGWTSTELLGHAHGRQQALRERGHRKFKRPFHITESHPRVSDNGSYVNLAAAGPYARLNVGAVLLVRSYWSYLRRCGLAPRGLAASLPVPINQSRHAVES